MRRSDNGTWVWKFDPLHRTTSPQPFYTEQAIEFYRRIECPVLVILGKESRQTLRPDVQTAPRRHQRSPARGYRSRRPYGPSGQPGSIGRGSYGLSKLICGANCEFRGAKYTACFV